MEFTFESNSGESTRELGILFGSYLKSPSVVALNGGLGSGKTHFARAVAEGLGVTNLHEVCSPTYTLVNEYSFQIRSTSPPRTGKAGCFGGVSGERPSSPEPPSLNSNIFTKCGDVTGEESKCSETGILYHADFYRLKTADDLDDVGFYDFAFDQGLCLIEWAERFPQVLNAAHVEIRFTPTSAFHRVVTFTFKSPQNFDAKRFISNANRFRAHALSTGT
jgi:tRNA threonylcarbamoyladenosine biosynthesis protein TsaE